jgi:spermidine synthase
MVQPMVGKLVLPLLGGSPAVWNACMVFFQALLLLGYLYADRLTRVESPRKQWIIHMGVLALPVAAFALSVALSARETPISTAESLAPTEGSSAILSVLAILTLAIGVPFFVVSTSATLLQKWFTYTGHPSARDPYFLYAASNFGSLISLLGYPIFIEPNMTQGAQTWFWASGFVALVALIAFCGRAAVNPLGVPPVPALAGAKVQGLQNQGKQSGGQQTGGQKAAGKPTTAGAPAPSATGGPADLIEAPPSWARMAKWTVLAFVPSSLMLGVTFHMTTDIASIPLLWVGPLALYLVTFIIAFGRVPPWFRVLIGNLAPVMILLLVFLMISDVNPGVGLSLLLYNLTFFAAALMCHYELARDRPSPQYLTTYFLIMSLGGVLGGIFNSLIAPLVFTHAYEFPLALIIACLMVPQLTAGEETEAPAKREATATDQTDPGTRALEWAEFAAVVVLTALFLIVVVTVAQSDVRGDRFKKLLYALFGDDSAWLKRVLLTVLGAPALIGVLGIAGMESYAHRKHLPVGQSQRLWHQCPWWGRALLLGILPGLTLPWAIVGVLWSRERLRLFLDLIIPVVVGLAFWQLQKLPGYFDWYGKMIDNVAEAMWKLSPNTIAIIITYALPVMVCFFFVDRPLRFGLAVAAILGPVKINSESSGTIYTERSFFGILKVQEMTGYEVYLLDRTDPEHPVPVRDPEGKPVLLHQFKFRKLVHGTTLHGTQVVDQRRHPWDSFQLFTIGNRWDTIGVAGAQTFYNACEEPLTYYHRTGPVGAMFAELTRRGKDKEHVAMVGLGTGSVSCYAQKGQKLTFYEIDPAVKRLVADSDEYFTYVSLARKRGAELDFRMGDARLKLKEDTDRKYQLLLVDAFSSDSIPIHLLTVEAVKLYLERLTDDGILALHISNKFVRLEPVVAAIAKHHNLVARVWNDDAERGMDKFGKTASSWVVLARKPEDLGAKLCSPIGEWVDTYGENEQILEVIKQVYPEVESALKPVPKVDPKNPPDAKELDKLKAQEQEQRTRLLEWLDKRGPKDPYAPEFARWIRLTGSEYRTLMGVLHADTGYGFRPVVLLKDVDAWTDDYADVMRVMMIEQLQAVRGFFGLPTPVKR